MAMPSIGKLRGLQQISYANGVFAMAAMDHRQSLQRMIDPSNPPAVGYDTLVGIKKELVAILGPLASAVLLDPLYGAAPAIASGVLPRETGLLVSVEASGYTGDPHARITELQPDWSVAKVKRMGGSAVKLLVYYRREVGAAAARQIEIVRQVAEECRQHDIPAVVEAVGYLLKGESREDFMVSRPRIVVETAEDLTPLPIDVFKAEFPADMRVESDEGRLLSYCQQLDAASRVPWVLLSGGVSFEQFASQLRIACRAGASGFLGGRAIWQDGVTIPDAQQRVRFLETTAADRLRRLTDIAGADARPWHAKMGLSPAHLTSVAEDWYAKY
jgi:tagatose 1,6-diphosphate aldolase